MKLFDRYRYWFIKQLLPIITGYIRIASSSTIESGWNETEKGVKEDENADSVTSAHVTTSPRHYTDAELTTVSYGSKTILVVMAIACFILVAIVLLGVVVYQRIKCAQVKSLHIVELTEVDNRQHEADIYADETQGISLLEDKDPLSLYKLAEDDPSIYSEVEQRKLDWKESKIAQQFTTAKTKAPVEAYSAGSDVYAQVKKPSKNPATSSALKTDQVQLKGLVKNGGCFPNPIYSLASDDMADIYANESVVDSSTPSVAEGVSKSPSPQDDLGQTVIENGLYCH